MFKSIWKINFLMLTPKTCQHKQYEYPTNIQANTFCTIFTNPLDRKPLNKLTCFLFDLNFNTNTAIVCCTNNWSTLQQLHHKLQTFHLLLFITGHPRDPKADRGDRKQLGNKVLGLSIWYGCYNTTTTPEWDSDPPAK